MPKFKNKKPLIKYLIAVILGLIIFFSVSVIFALIIVKTPYPKENTISYAVLSMIVSSFFASFYYTIKEKQNGLISGLIIGAILSAFFFLIYSSFSAFSLIDSSLLIIPASIVPSAVAGILAVNIKRK